MKFFLMVFFSCTLLFAQQYGVSNIQDHLKKNANIIIRNSTSDYTIKSASEIEIIENNTITILNKAGDDFSRVVIPYDKQTKIDDIKVVVMDQSGKPVKTYSKKDFSDFSHTPSFGLYVDNRVLVLNPTATSYPYTLQYSYKLTTKNTVFIPDFYPRGAFNVAVEKSKRIVRNPSGVKLRVKISPTDFGKPNVQENGSTKEYEYSNLSAIQHESYAPTIDFLDPKVEFALEDFALEGKQGSIKNWNDFGKWYYDNLLTPSTVISPELKQEIDALKLTGTTSEKVKKIFQYMQNKTRYVLISMGIGGWKPMSTEEVRVKGYGDCKGLTNYMRSLLMAAGIPSYYAIIKSNNSPQKFDPDFPKMGGNHVILMVPTEKETIWLENTSQNIAFNHLSYSTTNRNVLAVKEHGIEIINTPVYSAEQSKEAINAKVKILPDLSMEADAKFLYTGGQYDFKMPLVLKSAKEQSDMVSENLDYLKVKNFKMENFLNNRDDAEISYNVKLNAADYSKRMGEDLFFRVMPFYESFELNANDTRNLPFEAPFAYQDIYTVEFIAPAGYKFAEIPDKNEVSSDFGAYTITYKLLETGVLQVIRNLTVNKGVYPKEKFSQYADFRKKTAIFDNTKILLTQNK